MLSDLDPALLERKWAMFSADMRKREGQALFGNLFRRNLVYPTSNPSVFWFDERSRDMRLNEVPGGLFND